MRYIFFSFGPLTPLKATSLKWVSQWLEEMRSNQYNRNERSTGGNERRERKIIDASAQLQPEEAQPFDT